jgi:hypothetical protein
MCACGRNTAVSDMPDIEPSLMEKLGSIDGTGPSGMEANRNTYLWRGNLISGNAKTGNFRIALLIKLFL